MGVRPIAVVNPQVLAVVGYVRVMLNIGHNPRCGCKNLAAERGLDVYSLMAGQSERQVRSRIRTKRLGYGVMLSGPG
jgi:hypothetical protein